MELLRFIRPFMMLALVVTPLSSLYSSTPQSAPNIDVKGWVLPNKVGRGRTAQGTITMDIPAGYHVNSNKPLERFLIPTQLKVEAPSGVRLGPVLYPRPQLRVLKFSKNRVAVFERRTIIRFSVTVPVGFSGNSVELKARLRYQSCNDEACFPPQNKDLSLWLKVE